MAHKRRKELDRVIKYAEGLGMKVTWKTAQRGDPAATWTHDPLEICVYEHKNQSITSLILAIIHELGHYMYWVHHGRKPIPDAYMLEADRKHHDPKVPKKLRRQIYNYEANSIAYMPVVFKELDLSIPKYKLDIEVEFDLWSYEYYLEKGEDPTPTMYKDKRKELKLKYTCKE